MSTEPVTAADLDFLDAYQIAAAKTALYPKVSPVPLYPALGLAGESGELIAAWLKASEDDPASFDAVNKEMGDVLWYVAALATDHEMKLSELMGVARFSEIVDIGDVSDDACGFPNVCVQVGVVCECLKKALRDDNGVIAAPRLAKLVVALRSIIQTLSTMGNSEFDCATLGACANLNIAKLQARAAANTIKGDGDNR